MIKAHLSSALDLNEPVDPTDRFAYGWRYVKKVAKNGSEKLVQVPLTLEDILHPQEEDFRVLSDPHTQDTNYLYGVFKTALAKIPGAYVLLDCRVAWDRQGKYGHGPDVAVIFNVKAYGAWSTFNVVKEKTKPALIVEVTSPSTRSTDLVNKVREYAEQGVPRYVIADAKEKGAGRQLALIDYHLSKEQGMYYSMPLSDDGRIWLPELKMWLGAEAGRVVCWNVKKKRIGTIVEIEQARIEAEKAAELAEKAAELAEKRAEEERTARLTAEAKAVVDREMLEARIKELEQRARNGPGSKGRNGANGK